MENDTAHLEPAKVWLKLHETSRSTISRKDALTESERDLYEALTAKFTFDAKMLATVVDGTPCSVSYLEGALAKAKTWSIHNSSYSHHTEEHREWLRGYADYPDKFTPPNATVIGMATKYECA